MSSVKIVPVAASFLLLGLLLSGCVGGQAGGEKESQPGSTVDAGPSADSPDAEVGDLKGFVLSDELEPLPGASVALLNTSFEAKTDDQGAFAFLNLPLATYTVVAQKLGYESRALRAVTVAGQATYVNITLVPLPTAEAHYITDVYSTVVECSLVTGAWVSPCSYPYTAVYLTAKGMGVNLSNYGLPPDIQRNDVRHNYTVGLDVMNVVSELVWKPNTDLAKLMWLHQCFPEYDPIQDYCPKGYVNVHAASPINIVWKVPKSPRAQDGNRYWILSAVWPYPEALTSVGIYLEQRVTMYNTHFYGAESPEGWSAAVPAG